jgi:hypothetical protein
MTSLLTNTQFHQYKVVLPVSNTVYLLFILISLHQLKLYDVGAYELGRGRSHDLIVTYKGLEEVI